MSDKNTNTDNTDEPTKAELHERVQQLESTVAKMMPSRRDALKLGAAGIAGAAGLGATSQSAEASTGSAGTIGSSGSRPDLFADDIDANSLSGSIKNQGCRVFLSSQQTISQSTPTKIQFDREGYDSGNNFSTSSHDWTCPETGLYAVNLQVEFLGGASGDQRRTEIGTTASNISTDEGSRTEIAASTSDARVQTTTINKYNSGDTIAGYATNLDNSDTVGSGGSNFETFMEVAFLGGF